MSTRKVSIIIPVYNVEKYIDECLQSVLLQTYKNLEIILINDGSTDSSGIICDKYAEIDNRVRVFHKENGGVSSARNLGLKNVTGDYITFVDPDDWIELDMYENMVLRFEDNIDAVFCGYWEAPESETGLTPIVHQPEKQGVVDGEEALFQCLIGIGYGYFTSVWNKMFRASFLKKHNIYFEDYMIAEDELWLARVLPLCSGVQMLSKPFYHWRQSADSALRGTGNYEKWYSALLAKKAMIEYVKQHTEMLSLSQAKIYNDVFDVVWRAYINDDLGLANDFLIELRNFEKAFYHSKFFSIKKRCKFLVLKLMMKTKFPKSMIFKIANLNTYRIKEKYTL